MTVNYDSDAYVFAYFDPRYSIISSSLYSLFNIFENLASILIVSYYYFNSTMIMMITYSNIPLNMNAYYYHSWNCDFCDANTYYDDIFDIIDFLYNGYISLFFYYRSSNQFYYNISNGRSSYNYYYDFDYCRYFYGDYFDVLTLSVYMHGRKLQINPVIYDYDYYNDYGRERKIMLENVFGLNIYFLYFCFCLYVYYA